MITLFFLLPLLVVFAVIRLIALPFRFRRHRRWGSGCNGYGYGGRRRGFGGGGLLTVLGLLAVERLFGRRW